MPKYKFDQIAFNSTEKKKPTEDDKYTYIGLEHLDSGCLEVTRYGSDVAPIGEKLVMRKGDVLFGKRRAYQKKVAIAPFDGIFSAHGLVLRPKEDVIDRDFFPFFISSDYFLDAAIKISVGSLSPTINWRELKELEFELPDLAVQRDLAKIFMAMNEAKKAYKELITQTEQLVQSQFIEMFGNDTVGWKYSVVPFSTVGVFTTGGTPSQKDSAEYVGNTPWITTVSLGSNYVDESNAIAFISQQAIDESATHLIPKNSLMIGIRVGVGKTSINTVPMCTSQDIVSVHSVSPQFSLLFLKKVVDSYSDYFEENKRGATIKGIPSTMVKEINIPVVDLDIQKRFEQVVLQLDKSKFAAKQALENLERTQKSLMNRYLG